MKGKAKQKKPNVPNLNKGKRLPVNVRSYFKRGKRVKGYERRKPGDSANEVSK